MQRVCGLLVEDDVSFRRTLEMFLGVHYEVRAAADLASARTALRESSFDFVLLDKRLPDGSGLDLIPEIREKFPRTAILVLTGDTDYSTAAKCLLAGADDYVVKAEHTVPDLFVRIPVAMRRLAQPVFRPEWSIPANREEITELNYRGFLQSMESLYLERTLALCAGSVTMLAERIGVARSTLFKKVGDLSVTRHSKSRGVDGSLEESLP